MPMDLTPTENPVRRPDRLLLAGVPIDRMTMRDSLRWIASELRSRPRNAKPMLVMGPNAHIVTTAQRSPEFLSALAGADLCVPDGISVVLAGLFLGKPIPERVTGGDLMEKLCEHAARENFSVFFLGGLPSAAERAAAVLKRRYPGLQVRGCCPRLQFEKDPAELETVLDTIRSAAPDILCVALGVPRQETWMQRHCASLPIRLAISVGAALDTQAGLRQRAPEWTHKLGLEWAYRLAREPRRLWRRYLIGNTHFIFLVLAAWWRKHLDNRRPLTSTAKTQQPSRQK